MKGKDFLIGSAVAVLIILWLIARFVIGGPEDDWICVEGKWVKHGNPSALQPTAGCGRQEPTAVLVANPASVYCVEQGGTLEIRTATDGGQLGWCKFSDGRECDEWDFFRNKVCGSAATISASATITQKEMTFEESKKIAENFVKDSPTYKFDGLDLKFEASQILKCPSCWQFTFAFQCRQAGYGDRTDKILAQVITPHKIVVETVGDEVTKAIVDEKYDELEQKLLE